MATTTLTSKGQLTLPKAMREELKLKPGDKIDFVKCETGEYVVRPANKDVRALSGFLAGMYKGPPVSIEDMDKGIADYLSKKHARILRESGASDKKRKSR